MYPCESRPTWRLLLLCVEKRLPVCGVSCGQSHRNTRELPERSLEVRCVQGKEARLQQELFQGEGTNPLCQNEAKQGG